MATTLTLPLPLQRFFSQFPLYVYPSIPPPIKYRLTKPTIWIAPPRSSDQKKDGLLSSDVECLKWQAYLALRGLTDISVRWDIAPEGAIGERLPNLQVPAAGDKDGELLAAQMVPGWVDGKLGNSELEGYKDESLKDESHAWVSLLEGIIHAALTLSQPPPSIFSYFSMAATTSGRPIEAILSPPPASFTGLSSLLPPYGTTVSLASVQARYAEAIGALSERLGTDRWFLGSENPTALDALAFAYLHTILQSQDSTRIEVARRVNLVAWEHRVRTQVQAAFSVAT
ncbi:hypothetical protein BJ138DRAFT_1152228 [Hygrophoropsis aurantiaca]|uniref:Uncharacterized protein n=1 Tax=Hygrophoropsis aurantiaca TaxID=72124 RepID=A0ACB8AD79_9AGAM|nr:hypothetical protein BJ138DRAFT_1152228 [Hygrophoropsis aurantiaca]